MVEEKEERVLEEEGEDNGEYNLEMDLEGENERVESDMKPNCFIIVETSLDLNEFSAAINDALIS